MKGDDRKFGGRNELENINQMKEGGKKNRDTRKRGKEI